MLETAGNQVFNFFRLNYISPIYRMPKTRRKRSRVQRGGNADQDLWNAAKGGNFVGARNALLRGANTEIKYGSRETTALFEAVIQAFSASDYPIYKRTYKEVILELLRVGANPNTTDKNGVSPLLFIARVPINNTNILGDLIVNDILPILLKKGADSNLMGNGTTPFLEVIKSEYKLRIELMIQHGADPTIKDSSGNDAFYYVTKYSDSKFHDDATNKRILKKDYVGELLNKWREGAAPATAAPATPLNLNELINSAKTDESIIDTAQKALTSGRKLDLETQQSQGYTPLINAMKTKRKDVAMFLLDVGANPNVKYDLGKPALFEAIRLGDLPLVQKLVEKGAILDYILNGRNALHIAAEVGNVPIADFLVEKGVNINQMTDGKTTPLLLALNEGNVQMVKFLLDKGAAITERVTLWAASKQKFHDFLPKILQNGGNPNELSPEQKTSVLQYAIANKCMLNTVKLLVEAGANVNHINNERRTALSIAASNGKPSEQSNIITYLLKNGADPNKGYCQFEPFGDLPVAFKLVANKELVPLSLLLEKGMRVNDVITLGTSSGSTYSLLKMAIYAEDQELCKKLLDAGASPNQVLKDISILHYVFIPLPYKNKYGFAKTLVDAGADVNSQVHPTRDTPLHLAVRATKAHSHYYGEIVSAMDILIKAGANLELKNSAGETPRDLTDDERLLPMLGATMKFWQGWTRSDIEFLNGVLSAETRPTSNNSGPNNLTAKANDYSLCPVCLKTVDRPKGCMHMKHDCASQPGFYHKALYDRYKTDGGIHWCTICNRIGWGQGTQFLHYNLDLARNPVPTKAANSYLFDKDCSARSGGGGLVEKFHRFQRLRQVAYQLNNPRYVGVKRQKDVLETLVEVMWNAPLVENPDIEELWEERRWNIPNTAFPLPANASVSNSNNANIPVPSGTLDPIVHPTETDEITDVTMVSETDIIQFRHGENMHDGEGQQISRKAFASWLSDILGEYSSERFGHCWQFSEADYGENACKVKLYPREVFVALGLDKEEGENAEYRKLYEGYRKLFKRKEKGTL